jgi:hypothetical protein
MAFDTRLDEPDRGVEGRDGLLLRLAWIRVRVLARSRQVPAGDFAKDLLAILLHKSPDFVNFFHVGPQPSFGFVDQAIDKFGTDCFQLV